MWRPLVPPRRSRRNPRPRRRRMPAAGMHTFRYNSIRVFWSRAAMLQLNIGPNLATRPRQLQAGRLAHAETLYPRSPANSPTMPTPCICSGSSPTRRGGMNLAVESIKPGPRPQAQLCRRPQQPRRGPASQRTVRCGHHRLSAGPRPQPQLCRSLWQSRHALQAQGQLDAAIAAYRQASPSSPNYPEACGNLRQRPASPGPTRRGHRRLPPGPRPQPQLGRSPP